METKANLKSCCVNSKPAAYGVSQAACLSCTTRSAKTAAPTSFASFCGLSRAVLSLQIVLTAARRFCRCSALSVTGMLTTTVCYQRKFEPQLKPTHH